MRYTQRDEEAAGIKKHVDNVASFMSLLYRLDLSDDLHVHLNWQASCRHAVYKLEVFGSPRNGHRIERIR